MIPICNQTITPHLNYQRFPTVKVAVGDPLSGTEGTSLQGRICGPLSSEESSLQKLTSQVFQDLSQDHEVHIDFPDIGSSNSHKLQLLCETLRSLEFQIKSNVYISVKKGLLPNIQSFMTPGSPLTVLNTPLCNDEILLPFKLLEAGPQVFLCLIKWFQGNWKDDLHHLSQAEFLHLIDLIHLFDWDYFIFKNHFSLFSCRINSNNFLKYLSFSNALENFPLMAECLTYFHKKINGIRLHLPENGTWAKIEVLANLAHQKDSPEALRLIQDVLTILSEKQRFAIIWEGKASQELKAKQSPFIFTLCPNTTIGLDLSKYDFASNQLGFLRKLVSAFPLLSQLKLRFIHLSCQDIQELKKLRHLRDLTVEKTTLAITEDAPLTNKALARLCRKGADSCKDDFSKNWYLELACQLYPAKSKYWTALAYHLYNQYTKSTKNIHHLQKAAECIDKALALKPHYLDAIEARCAVRFCQKDTIQALLDAYRVLKYSPKSVTALYVRSKLLVEFGFNSLALADAQNISRISQDNAIKASETVAEINKNIAAIENLYQYELENLNKLPDSLIEVIERHWREFFPE